MTKKTYFITGIGTDVGKTLVAAILVEALQADYWKPVQAGDLHDSDTDKVKRLVSNSHTRFFANAYAFKTPMSPHAAASIDEVEIKLPTIKRPQTTNHLVIEGAGGLLVPLTNEECIIDLLLPTDEIILVSRHYLGSINHTLLSIEALRNRGFQNIHILFNGDEHPTTEEIILHKTKLPCLGRIPNLPKISAEVVAKHAVQLRKALVG